MQWRTVGDYANKNSLVMVAEYHERPTVGKHKMADILQWYQSLTSRIGRPLDSRTGAAALQGSKEMEEESSDQDGTEGEMKRENFAVVKTESDSDEIYPRRNGLFSITKNLRFHKSNTSGETTTNSDSLESSPVHQSSKVLKRKRMERSMNNNGPIATPISAPDYASHNNNNNHVKNERLSPGTPDTSSRSRSVTPSSASHPDTPPAPENLLMPGRNYSDFMRSLAAKYNNTNPNDYFNAARNGFPPPIDPRFKPTSAFPSLIPLAPQNNGGKENDAKKQDFPVLNPFATTMFPPLIDMSTTQTLLAMVRTAKEAELQGLLKNVKRPEPSSPLDLSAGGAPPPKRARTKTPSSSASPTCAAAQMPKRACSESPKLDEDVSNWSVEDVCNFVAGIDICSEYAQRFREQRIDGSGLPMLTEEHLTSTMNMKLGPALKLRSILAKRLGSCSVCLHCTHCHNGGGGGGANGSSSESGGSNNNAGNLSDSGGIP